MKAKIQDLLHDKHWSRLLCLLLALAMIAGFVPVIGSTVVNANAGANDVKVASRTDYSNGVDDVIRLDVHPLGTYTKHCSAYLEMDRDIYSKLSSATYTISFNGDALDLAGDAVLGSADYYSQYYDIKTTKTSSGSNTVYTVAITPNSTGRLPGMAQGAAVIEYDLKIKNEDKIAEMLDVPVTVTLTSVECIKEADNTIASLTPNVSSVINFQAAYRVNLELNGGTAGHDYACVIPNDVYGWTTYDDDADSGFQVMMPFPTRQNYVFDGWYTAQTGGKEIDILGTRAPAPADMPATLYARWTPVAAGALTGGKVEWRGQTTTVDKDTLKNDDEIDFDIKLYVDPNTWRAYSVANLNVEFDGELLEYMETTTDNGDIIPMDMPMNADVVRVMPGSMSFTYPKSDGYVFTATLTMKVLDAAAIKTAGGATLKVSYFNEDAAFIADGSANGLIDRMELVDAGTAETRQPTKFTNMALALEDKAVIMETEPTVSGNGYSVVPGAWTNTSTSTTGTTGTATFYVKVGSKACTSTDGLYVTAALANGFEKVSTLKLSDFGTAGTLSYAGPGTGDYASYGKFTYTYSLTKSSVASLTLHYTGSDSTASYDLVMPGDSNKSGTVNTTDASIILRTALKVSGYPMPAVGGAGNYLYELLDMNKSNSINTTDASIALRMAAKIITPSN